MTAQRDLMTSNGSNPPRAALGVQRARWWTIAIGSLLVAALFGWLLYAGALPVVPPSASFAELDWFWVAGFALAFVASSLIRAAKWTWLLAPVRAVPLKHVVSVSLTGYAALLLLPFRTGELVRPALIRRHGISGWVAIGTVGAERIVDGLTVTILLVLGLAFSDPLDPLPRSIGDLPVPAALVPTLSWLAVGLFSAAFLVMAIFYVARASARRIAEKTLGSVSPRAASWIADRIDALASGIGFLPNWRLSSRFVLATAAYWLVFALANWMLLRATGLRDVGLDETCVLIGVFSIAILLPNAPGMFGAFQLSLYAALAMYLPAERVMGPGAAFVFLNYVGQIVLTLSLGGVGLAVERAQR